MDVRTHILGAALDDGVAEHLLEHVLAEDGHLLREEPQLYIYIYIDVVGLV